MNKTEKDNGLQKKLQAKYEQKGVLLARKKALKDDPELRVWMLIKFLFHGAEIAKSTRVADMVSTRKLERGFADPDHMDSMDKKVGEAERSIRGLFKEYFGYDIYDPIMGDIPPPPPSPPYDGVWDKDIKVAIIKKYDRETGAITDETVAGEPVTIRQPHANTDKSHQGILFLERAASLDDETKKAAYKLVEYDAFEHNSPIDYVKQCALNDWGDFIDCVRKKWMGKDTEAV